MRLLCVIYGCTVMTGGAYQPSPQSPASQSGPADSGACRGSARGGRRDARACAISPRQAYRYLQEARHLTEPVPVGDQKVAFTVKLSRRLVTQVRSYARAKRLTLSELVSRALRAWLPRG